MNRLYLLKFDNDYYLFRTSVILSFQEISKFEIKQENRYLVRDADVTRICNGKGGAKKFEELRLYILNDKAVFTKKGKQ
jgi:hypothetical protein